VKSFIRKESEMDG